MGAPLDLDSWLEKVKRCEYLAEEELKTLCEYVSDCSCIRWVAIRAARREEAHVCCR